MKSKLWVIHQVDPIQRGLLSTGVIDFFGHRFAVAQPGRHKRGPGDSMDVSASNP